MPRIDRTDVVVIGGGLAGLSLCRQLLLETDKKILLLEKRSKLPPDRQKVGESLVQVGGYYFGRVLDLEEYLFRHHLMKYNLRFYWKSEERRNEDFEDYAQAYIRNFSNIPCYQLDRNEVERELLRLNRESDRFQLASPARIQEIQLGASEDDDHRVSYRLGGEEYEIHSKWIVDTSGRARKLARRQELDQASPIRHGASFLWVDGLVDIDKLNSLSARENRIKASRRNQGHLPVWLATNHFMGEGFWFWVIPLQGKTSLGLVYDRATFPSDEVSDPQKLIRWVCREFPLFQRDLPSRTILDYGWYRDFALGCKQTIDAGRWALSGEAGRFADPLYSPGSDFIAVHNTLIVNAILTTDDVELAVKCRLYELVMRSLYESLVPSFSRSYDTLGDQEAFTLKYTWELSVYFGFFVFPFINGLMSQTRFLLPYLDRFSRLGPINSSIQSLLSEYYQWKKRQGLSVVEPVLHELTEFTTLRQAESVFYQVGVQREDAVAIMDAQLQNLEELARFIAAHVFAEVLGDRRVRTNRSFVESLDLGDITFDPAQIRKAWSRCCNSQELVDWPWDAELMDKFHPRGQSSAAQLSRTSE